MKIYTQGERVLIIAGSCYYPHRFFATILKYNSNSKTYIVEDDNGARYCVSVYNVYSEKFDI